MLQQVRGEVPAEALAGWERLACAYWQPLYVFLRRRGADHHGAADDIQGFFAHLLSRDFLRRVEPGHGHFRTFLLTCLQNWRTDQRRAATAQKRGGGQAAISLADLEAVNASPVSTEDSPEEAYDRRWARSVYDNALAALHARLKARGREPLFLHLRGVLTGQSAAKYREIAAELELTEGAVKQAVLDLRREFGVTLRDEVRRTTVHETLVDDEVRYLLKLLRQ